MERIKDFFIKEGRRLALLPPLTLTLVSCGGINANTIRPGTLSCAQGGVDMSWKDMDHLLQAIAQQDGEQDKLPAVLDHGSKEQIYFATKVCGPQRAS